MARQEERARAVGVPFGALAVRRMLALLAIGIAHIVLLWWGDILCAYAIMGLLLLPLRRLPPRWLRIAAASTLAAVGGLLALVLLAMTILGYQPEEPTDLAATVALHQQGGYGEILWHRLAFAAEVQLFTVFMAPVYLPLVLLGYDAVRSGWFPKAGDPWQSWPRPVIVGLALGVGLNVIGATLPAVAPRAGTAGELFALPGSFAVAWIVLFLAMQPPPPLFRPVTERLAAVGRTALSNYLLQSLLGALVFFGFGLGLHGRVGALEFFGIAVAIVAGQLVWSPAWLRRFRFGPAEALWRRMTYGARRSQG